MPEILADQHAHPAKSPRLAGRDAIAGGKIALLLEHAVGRQIDLAMDVHDAAGLGQQGGVVIEMPRRFLDKAEDQRPPARRRRPARQFRRHRAAGPRRGPCRGGNSRSARARERGSDRPLARGRPAICSLCSSRLRAPIAQQRRDLRQGHARHAGAAAAALRPAACGGCGRLRALRPCLRRCRRRSVCCCSFLTRRSRQAGHLAETTASDPAQPSPFSDDADRVAQIAAGAGGIFDVEPQDLALLVDQIRPRQPARWQPWPALSVGSSNTET